MKNVFLICLLFVSVTFLQAQEISVNQAEATVSFNFIDDDVDGTLSGFEFFGNIDLSDLSSSNISGAVQTETIDTNNWLRNRHLRRKYFKAKDFPKLTFNSTSISGTADNFSVKGTLTIKGIAKEVTWTFKKSGNSLVGTTQVNTQDYDIAIHKEYKTNEASIRIWLPFQ